MSTETLPTQLAQAAEAPDLYAGKLPVARQLKLVYFASLFIALLTAAASAAGLLRTDVIYPSPELQQSFVANDMITLVLGLPLLLGSMWLAWRGHFIGLLFWPGAIFYGLYNYLAYLFGMPFTGLFVLYLVIVVTSLYTLIVLLTSIDGPAVQARLGGHVPERFAGGVLILLGTVFLLFAGSTLINNLAGRAALPHSELAVFVADFFASPAWVIGGVLLWRRQPLGYVGGTGLLFSVSMLFIGVIGIVLLQAVMDGGPFLVVDLLVLVLMGTISIIPFGLYVRGILKS